MHGGGPDPTLWPAVTQVEAITERTLGCEELLDLVLARIDAIDEEVGAVCTLDEVAARRRAREADASLARGERWGELHGLPMTVKDAIAVAGMRATGGSARLVEHVPATDAPAVCALREAGAVIIGKTNLPEWSGDWQSHNEMFGTTVNPWDRARTCGGSSGGAAAAVACGMSAVELGTDIGGSVRVPSAFCGVFGHKPTFGVIPTLGYLDEPLGGSTASDVNTFGPIARDARDLALLLDVLTAAQREAREGWALRLAPAPAPDEVRRLRLGAWIDDPALEGDVAMTGVIAQAVDAVEASGATVDRGARLDVDVADAWRLGARLIGAAVSISDDDEPGVSHRDWIRMHRSREQLRLAWHRLFARVDVLLCPVTIVPAFAHLQEGHWSTRTLTVDGRSRRYVDLEGWPALVGAAYLPSTAVPVGRTPEGLPVGVQVVAPAFHDHRSIAVARLLGEVTLAVGGGYHPPPAVTGAVW